MYFSQKDPRWASNKVGYGKMTFSQVGCLLTSVANKLKFDGIEMTPLEVNELAKKCGAFNVDMLNMPVLATALGYSYVRQIVKPAGRHIFETNYYKKVNTPQHFCLMSESGKRIDPLDLQPSWEDNNYPVVSYRVMTKIELPKSPETKKETAPVPTPTVEVKTPPASTSEATVSTTAPAPVELISVPVKTYEQIASEYVPPTQPIIKTTNIWQKLVNALLAWLNQKLK
jgi:hypothetical protein